MRIIFINRFIGMFRGGGERFDLEIARTLRSNGVEVTFLTGRPLFSALRHPLDSFPTLYCRSPYLRDWTYRLNRGSARIAQLDLYLFSLACCRMLRSLGSVFDVIQVSGITPLWRLRNITGRPVVIRYPGPPGLEQKGDIERFDAVVANGDAWQFIRTNLRSDVIHIPPGVDSDLYCPGNRAEARRRLGLTHDRVILFVGRLIPIKNLDWLITTFANVRREVPNSLLLIVGEGTEKSRLEGLIADLSLSDSVSLIGAVSPEKLQYYYAAADLFVMPSYYDNFPNAVLEAMSAGLPVVATRTGGIPLQITYGQNGYLVEVDNSCELTSAILKLLKDPGTRQLMGERNRHKAKHSFSWERSAAQLMEIYSKLMR